MFSVNPFSFCVEEVFSEVFSVCERDSGGWCWLAVFCR